MSLYVDSTQEETFRLMTDYLTGKRMKIVVSTAPSYIRAEFGSWSLSELSYPKGEIEANIQERDSGTDVNFIFNFTNEYLRIFMEVCFALALIWTAFLLFSTLRPFGIGLSFSEGLVPVTLLTVAVVAVELTVYALRIPLTRKNLAKGFNRFASSPSQKG